MIGRWTVKRVETKGFYVPSWKIINPRGILVLVRSHRVDALNIATRYAEVEAMDAAFLSTEVPSK